MAGMSPNPASSPKTRSAMPPISSVWEAPFGRYWKSTSYFTAASSVARRKHQAGNLRDVNRHVVRRSFRRPLRKMAASGEAAKSGRKRPGRAVRHTGKFVAPQQYGMVRSGDARSGSAPFSRNSAGFAVVLAVSRQLDNFVRRNNVA